MKRGSRPAVYDTRRSLSYAQLYRAAWAISNQMMLRFRQAKKWPVEAPRVLYMTNRDVLNPMAQFAAWHLNGVGIPVSSDTKANELEYFVKASKADIVVCAADFAKRFDSIKNELNLPILALDKNDVDLACRSLMSRHAQVHPDKMEAMIIFTAGTTGQPKGVVHTHGSIEAQLKSCEEAW